MNRKSTFDTTNLRLANDVLRRASRMAFGMPHKPELQIELYRVLEVEMEFARYLIDLETNRALTGRQL